MGKKKLLALSLLAAIGGTFLSDGNCFLDRGNIVYARKSLTIQERLEKLKEDLIDSPWEALSGKPKKTPVKGGARGKSSSREEEKRPIMFPSKKSTLLSNEEVLFSWNRAEPYDFVIYDDQDEVVYRKTIQYEPKTVSIVPAKLRHPLQENQSYAWALINRRTKKEYKSAFTVLDRRHEEAVAACLRDMQALDEPQEANLMRQAAFLQELSDEYPNEMDFYWLSRQILSAPALEDEVLEQKYRAHKTYLLERCEEHGQ